MSCLLYNSFILLYLSLLIIFFIDDINGDLLFLLIYNFNLNQYYFDAYRSLMWYDKSGVLIKVSVATISIELGIRSYGSFTPILNFI